MKGFGAFVVLAATLASAKRIVISNDDGWATAQIRAQFNSLVAAGHDVRSHSFFIIYYRASNRIYHFKVILSCPADNESAHGALEIIATPRLTPCEFNSCPAGASTGNNASDSMHIYLHLEVR